MKNAAAVCLFLAALALPSEAGFLHRGLFGHKAPAAPTAPSAPVAAAAAAKDDEDDDDGVPAPSDPTPAVDKVDDTAALAPATDSSSADFPTLPAIEAITGNSADTMKSLNSQASVLEARIAQVQMENEQKLSRQKAIFEKRLKDQEGANRQVVSQNEQITKEISTLKGGNGKLRKHAEELAEGNRLKRAELRTLQAKLGVSSDFIQASIKATDDKGVKELAVLSAKAPVVAAVTEVQAEKAEKESDAAETDEKDTDDDKSDDGKDDKSDDGKDEDEKDDDEEKADSFMEMSSRVRRMRHSSEAEEGLAEIEADISDQSSSPSALVIPNKNPRDLLHVLSDGVDSLQKQEKASDAKLKGMFVTAFKKGTKRHQTLVSQQKALNATRSQLTVLKGKLEAADSHLEGRRDSLKERLRGLGLFLQRLGHLALAPSGEASKLMKSLPDVVTPQTVPAPTDGSAADASADASAGTSS